MTTKIPSKVEKELLSYLLDMLEEIKNNPTLSEETKTKMLLTKLGRFKKEYSIIREIPDLRVLVNDYITPAYMNKMYEGIADFLDDTLKQIATLTDDINNKLEQEFVLQDSLLNMEDVIDTKVNELMNQVKTKVNKSSVNSEYVVSVDFRKNVSTMTTDVINAALILHRKTSRRIDNIDILKTVPTPEPNYNDVTGIFNGRLVDDYIRNALLKNNMSDLMDNDLNTEYVIQGTYNTIPYSQFVIESENQFNMVYVISNGISQMFYDDTEIQNINNVFVFNTGITTANLITTNTNNRKDAIVPVVSILDINTNEEVKRLSYFKSMKVLDQDLFNNIIGSDDIFDEDIDINTLSKIGIISQSHDTIPITELIIKDIYIELNTYDNQGIWESGDINIGNNIISINIDADTVIYEGTDIKLSVLLPDINQSKWYELGLYNRPVQVTDNGIIPNRIVFNPDMVSPKDGDIHIQTDKPVETLRLRVELTSNKTYLTPIITNINIRTKIAEQ